MTTYYLITFDSTHLAIRTERVLKVKFKVVMIPTPRDLSASCGLSLMLETESIVEAASDLKEESFEGMHLYRVVRSEAGVRQYDELEWRF